jgi:hypothetical protein
LSISCRHEQLDVILGASPATSGYACSIPGSETQPIAAGAIWNRNCPRYHLHSTKASIMTLLSEPPVFVIRTLLCPPNEALLLLPSLAKRSACVTLCWLISFWETNRAGSLCFQLGQVGVMSSIEAFLNPFQNLPIDGRSARCLVLVCGLNDGVFLYRFSIGPFSSSLTGFERHFGSRSSRVKCQDCRSEKMLLRQRDSEIRMKQMG